MQLQLHKESVVLPSCYNIWLCWKKLKMLNFELQVTTLEYAACKIKRGCAVLYCRLMLCIGECLRESYERAFSFKTSKTWTQMLLFSSWCLYLNCLIPAGLLDLIVDDRLIFSDPFIASSRKHGFLKRDWEG